MYQRSGLLFTLAAAWLMSVTIPNANAAERTRYHHVVKRIHVNNLRIVNKRVVIKIDRHRHNRPVDIYSGNVAIYYRPHVGTWSYGSFSVPADAASAQSSVKIIDIDRLGGKNDCHMELGVCVIRP